MGKYTEQTEQLKPERELLWQGGYFNFFIPYGIRARPSEFLGHSFAKIPKNPKVEGKLATTFLHDGSISLEQLFKQKNRLVICEVEIWKVTNPDGGINYFLDYKPTRVTSASRTLKVAKPENADKVPAHMGGTIIAIGLHGNRGQILVGDRISSRVGNDARDLANVQLQNS